MSTFYQLETDFRYVNCGMCWVLLLDDGTLVVEDGGYFAPGQAEALHAFFSGLCPGGVHIRAWLFSHAHQDHIGAFINYVRLYPDTVIDEIRFAFQPFDFTGVDGFWQDSDPATFREFYTVLKELPPSTRILGLETGEVLKYGEAEIEVLYTYKDAKEPITNFNDNSAVLMLKAKDTRFFLPGDAAKVAALTLMEKPEKLACDFTQVAHHGFNGLPSEVYAANKAEYSIWPMPHYEWDRNLPRSANTFVAENTKVITCADGTLEIPLPFTGEYKILPRIFPEADETNQLYITAKITNPVLKFS